MGHLARMQTLPLPSLDVIDKKSQVDYTLANNETICIALNKAAEVESSDNHDTSPPKPAE